jgi:catechol 2,3-dioxygenase-like lactoylglutathione lyase family enzyme
MATPPNRAVSAARAFHHVALSVGDLDAAAGWYREVLGLHDVVEYPVGEDGGKAIVLERHGFAVELFWSPGSRPRVPPADPVAALAQRGLTHVALTVADVTATHEELRRRGVTFVVPPTEYVEGVPVAFFRDPEGNLFELFPQALMLSANATTHRRSGGGLVEAAAVIPACLARAARAGCYAALSTSQNPPGSSSTLELRRGAI